MWHRVATPSFHFSTFLSRQKLGALSFSRALALTGASHLIAVACADSHLTVRVRQVLRLLVFTHRREGRFGFEVRHPAVVPEHPCAWRPPQPPRRQNGTSSTPWTAVRTCACVLNAEAVCSRSEGTCSYVLCDRSKACREYFPYDASRTAHLNRGGSDGLIAPTRDSDDAPARPVRKRRRRRRYRRSDAEL